MPKLLVIEGIGVDKAVIVVESPLGQTAKQKLEERDRALVMCAGFMDVNSVGDCHAECEVDIPASIANALCYMRPYVG